MTKIIKILIVLILLGLLIFTLFISINNYNKAKNNAYYYKQEEKMLKASKKYFSNNKYYLPKEINKNTRVVLNALVKENYLRQIKDINNYNCDNYKSYVEVIKISDNEYLYKSHLECDKSDYITKEKE